MTDAEVPAVPTEPPAEPEAPAPAEETAQEQPNGVLITKIVDEKGGIRTGLQVLGDVQVTEAQFLLELGIKEFRAAVGLGVG